MTYRVTLNCTTSEDHVPTISGPDPRGTAFAFVYGYIAAQLGALKAEGLIQRPLE